jgi:hypothetical protein
VPSALVYVSPVAAALQEASGFQHLSAPLQDLLRKLLRVSPAQRITADVIAAHPWLEQAPPPPTYVGMAGAGAGVGGGTTAAGAAGAAAAGVVAAAGGSTPGVEEEEEEPEASRDWSAFWPDAESLTGGGGGGGGGMSLPTSFSFGSDDSIDSMGALPPLSPAWSSVRGCRCYRRHCHTAIPATCPFGRTKRAYRSPYPPAFAAAGHFLTSMV